MATLVVDQVFEWVWNALVLAVIGVGSVVVLTAQLLASLERALRSVL